MHLIVIWLKWRVIDGWHASRLNHHTIKSSQTSFCIGNAFWRPSLALGVVVSWCHCRWSISRCSVRFELDLASVKVFALAISSALFPSLFLCQIYSKFLSLFRFHPFPLPRKVYTSVSFSLSFFCFLSLLSCLSFFLFHCPYLSITPSLVAWSFYSHSPSV